VKKYAQKKTSQLPLKRFRFLAKDVADYHSQLQLLMSLPKTLLTVNLIPTLMTARPMQRIMD